MLNLLLAFWVALGIGLVANRNMKLAVAAFCGLLPLYVVRASIPLPGIGQLPTTLLEAAFIGLFAVWFWKRGRHAEPWLEMREWLMPIGLLLLGAAIGVLVSDSTLAALGIFRAYFIEPLLFFVVFRDVIRAKEDVKWPLASFAVALIIIGLVAVFQKITGYGIPNPVWQDAATRRVTAFYGYPNAIGLFAAPLAVMFFGQAWTLIEDKKFRAALLPSSATALGILALVFAVSQGAMLGVAIGLFIIGITHKRLRLLTLLTAAGVLTLILALAPLREKAVALTTLGDDSGSVRVSIWSETAKMVADRPVFGGGLSGYKTAFEQYHEASHIEIFMYPHNLFLNFWTETGLIGLAGFVWIVGMFFTLAIRNWRRSGFWIAGAAACAMVALLVHGLVDVPYFKNDLSFLFWVVVGLGLI